MQTPYKDEDWEALTDKLYVCPQLRLFILESGTQFICFTSTKVHTLTQLRLFILESDAALTKEWVDRVTRKVLNLLALPVQKYTYCPSCACHPRVRGGAHEGVRASRYPQKILNLLALLVQK